MCLNVYVPPVYLLLCASSCADVEVSPVVDFVKRTQAAIFSAFMSCHQSLWRCCLIECWWLPDFPLNHSDGKFQSRVGLLSSLCRMCFAVETHHRFCVISRHQIFQKPSYNGILQLYINSVCGHFLLTESV